MGEQTPTVVVVDDAAEVRLLVKTRLRLSGRVQVVGEGADGAEAVEQARRHQPSVMLLDVSMPGMDGIEALPQVLEVSPGTRVVFYSGFEEQGLVERARQLGAAAFIEKSTPIDSLVDRLLAVLAPDELDAVPALVSADAGVDPEPDPPLEALDQEVLEEHLERFHEVFEEAAIGMATMTLTGRLVRVNRALAALLHRSADELVGTYYGALIADPGEDVAAALEGIRTGNTEVAQLEHPLAGAGEDRHVRTILAPVRDSHDRALYLFLQVQDISAQRAAIEELRQSEERFRLLVEAVEDYAIFMLDTGGHIISWNAGAQRIKGYTANEIIGQHFRVFYPPEVADRKHPEHELEVALREGHYGEEGWRLRKDGSPFWANVLITAVFNDRGVHVGFTKVTRDNTHRRQLEQEREGAVEALAKAKSELETLNERLQRTAEEQAEFLAVTAHELRTPIGVLGGSADTLARHWKDVTDEERVELLDTMASSSTRLRRLLADLLTASRLQASALHVDREPVQVASVVADAVATVRRTRTDPGMVVSVPPDLVVLADRDRLAQAVENLLNNALSHGTPPVRVSGHRVPQHAIQIRVTDEGGGVNELVRPRLFQRFATGRNQGGTGLGLFIVRELARVHGGEAFYEAPSDTAPGGAFVIQLPEQPAAETAPLHAVGVNP